jgi:hypothetical protein
VLYCSRVQPTIIKSSGAFSITKFAGNATIVDNGRKSWKIGNKDGAHSGYVFVNNIIPRRVGSKISILIKAGTNSYAELGFAQNCEHLADQTGNKMVGVSLGPSVSGVFNPNEDPTYTAIAPVTNINLLCELIFKSKGQILRVNGVNVYEGTADEWAEYYAYVGSGDTNELIEFENLRVVRN